ncbi:MAG: hypothetical protein JNL12_02335 [Planctomycetes bacterium]|nr:hypothetical protein [Planctomycetota bacterium]
MTSRMLTPRTRSAWRSSSQGTISGCKFAPATGQPRTEVPVGPDGSGTVLELGAAFWRNLANAVDCLPSDGHPIDAVTIKIAIRNLRAAVAELAKVVERIGPR